MIAWIKRLFCRGVKRSEQKLIEEIEQSIALDQFHMMHSHQQAAYLLNQIKVIEARIRLMNKEIGILKNTVRQYRALLNKKKAQNKKV